MELRLASGVRRLGSAGFNVAIIPSGAIDTTVGAGSGSPVLVSCPVAHGLSTGILVHLEGTGIDGVYVATVTGSKAFTLGGTTAVTVNTAGGTWTKS